MSYKKDGYNDATITLAPTLPLAKQAVTLVPNGKVYLLSNSSKTIDLIETNIDGTRRTIVLSGNGNEDQETGILPNVGDRSRLAIVSSRAGKRDSYGNPIHDLYIFNTPNVHWQKLMMA